MKSIKFKSERDVKREIKKILDAYGWFWFSPPANAYGANGISDILALRAGVVLAIEAKFNMNKPTALQKAFLQSVAAESAFGFVVNEVTYFAFARWMELFDKSCKAAETGAPIVDSDGAEMLDCIRAMTEDVVFDRRQHAA